MKCLAILSTLFVAIEITSAVQVTIKNKCDHPIDLLTRKHADFGNDVDTMPPGGECKRDVPKGYQGNFRHGTGDDATLVEFSNVGDMPLIWFDLSIIPPHLEPGHEYCKSLSECKAHSKLGKGYNVPVSLKPLQNEDGNRCKELVCLNDGCDDAYQYPQDDTKTHACPEQTDFLITFCPNGGSDTPQVQEGPAPVNPYPAEQEPGNEDYSIPVDQESPEQTSAPETQAPETQAPETQAPETQAPETDSPYQQEPETQAPETQAPETQAPETQAPETQAPETQAPETQAPETQAPETQAPETQGPVDQSPVDDYAQKPEYQFPQHKDCEA